jgi:1,4-dihydroxy-2-naphthoyl-CoA synthase
MTIESIEGAMESDSVLLEESSHGVITLTLNRPESFNALSKEMMNHLSSALTAIEANESARVLVLAAKGRAFCAGHDLKQMLSHPSQSDHLELFEQCSALMMQLQSLSIPVIAKVEGIATAAGCQLVAQCDLAVATSNARFAVSGVNLGLFCSTPGVALSRNLNRKAAFEMLVTGGFISAIEAQDKGLINQVVDPLQINEAVQSLAQHITQKPKFAIALGKKLFYEQLEMGMKDAYSLASATMACNMMDESANEGIRAFIEKREPSWRGTSSDFPATNT